MQAVTVAIELQPPFSVSLDTLHEIINTWKLRFLVGGTHRRIAKVEFPKETFLRMFGIEPVVGNRIAVPEEISKTIFGMTVVDP
jgi:hypothetical protein